MASGEFLGEQNAVPSGSWNLWKRAKKQLILFFMKKNKIRVLLLIALHKHEQLEL